MSIASELRLTNADLEAMPEDGNRYEVIDGELYVSSAPGYIHQIVLVNFIAAFVRYLAEHPIGRIIPGVGVMFDDYNGVIPDLIFVTNERLRKTLAGGRFQAAPEIAIEILSPGASNTRRDRHVKRSLYATRGVSEYWIVDPESRAVEVHRRNAAGELAFDKTFLQGDQLTSALLPEFGVHVETLFA
jgi:Uma2 family endonuclease